MTPETVGATLVAVRSDKKLSRKALLEQLGGKPWTTGRIGDLERGKHPWSYFRPAERAMLVAWLELQGIGATALAGADVDVLVPGAVVAADRLGVDDHLVYGDDGSPALQLLHEDDEPRLLELAEVVVPAAGTVAGATGEVALPPLQPGWEGRVDAAVAQAAVDTVNARLGGQPAPFPWPTLYRLDAAPPSDLERVMKWCERVHQWLDDVASGRAAYQPADGGSAVPTAPIVPPVEVLPAGPPDGTVTQLEPAALDVVGAAALTRDGLRRLTNSELQTFKHCRRRWWLSWYRGLRLRAEPPGGPKGIGTWVHDALARWYVPDGQTPEDPRLAYNELVQVEELALLQATTHLADTDVATKLADFQKDADMGRAMLEGYVEWLAETGADVGLTVVAPEQVLAAVLECSRSLTVQVQGRLDVRLRRDADLVHLFMDHKTVGNFTDPARRLPMDEQMKTYLLLEQAHAEGASYVDGALYNLLRRVKRTGTAKPPFYDRLEVRHNPTTVKTFRERLKGQALTIDLVERSLNDGVDHHLIAYPTPSARCTWGCEFSAVCTMFDDGSRAEDFIEEHYVVINPLDRYDHEETSS